MDYRKICKAITGFQDQKIAVFGDFEYHSSERCVFDFEPSGKTIFIRHDVDHDPFVALAMAKIEAQYGIRSSYFFLTNDTASGFFEKKHQREKSLDAIAGIVSLGHEVGLHYDPIGEFFATGKPIDQSIAEPLSWFREHGIEIHGCVAHGASRIRKLIGHDELPLEYCNYQIWHETNSDVRAFEEVGRCFSLPVLDLAEFDLKYEPYFVRKDRYLSDSGGLLWRTWNQQDQPFEKIDQSVALDLGHWLHSGEGPNEVLQILIHPIWWTKSLGVSSFTYCGKIRSLDHRLASLIHRKMVIFVSSIGRSGTRFIAELFDACTDIPSHHLLEPHCHGIVMEQAMIGKKPHELTDKMNVISDALSENKAYFESTPMFLRVLSEAVLERFDFVKVIRILRDPMEVARSYVNRDSYPSHKNRPWRVPLNTPQARFDFPAGLSPFQENLCDWLENELQFQVSRADFTSTTTLYFSDFNDPKALARTFDSLCVDFDSEKLQRHLTLQDLDRNANEVATDVSEEDIAEAKQLIEILAESGFPTERFRDAAYERFWFTKKLASTESKQMTYNRFYSEGGFNAASKEWLEKHTNLKKVAMLSKDRTLTLLDVGCGDGEWTEVLSEWYDATGIDLAEDGIALAKKRERSGLSFRCLDFNDLTEDDQFDVIFCRAPSFLNHETGSPVISTNIRKLLKHCRGRLYYIKYSKAPFERWVPSRVFANFDTHLTDAPDSKWYYNNPSKLQSQLRKIAATKVTRHGNYFVAEMDVSGKLSKIDSRVSQQGKCFIVAVDILEKLSKIRFLLYRYFSRK